MYRLRSLAQRLNEIKIQDISANGIRKLLIRYILIILLIFQLGLIKLFKLAFYSFFIPEELEVTGEHLTRMPFITSLVYKKNLLLKSKLPRWKNFGPAIMTPAYLESYEKLIKNFRIYSDDVFIIGFPRSGTTMLQELVWLILNDFDFEATVKNDVYNRCQWMDYFNFVCAIQGVREDHMENMKRPRLFKSHYPVQFMPHQVYTVKPKIIHITREVKDVACSVYHFRKDISHEYFSSIEDSFDDILEDKVWYGPYREHLINWQNIPDYENIFYLTYEGMISDIEGTIRKLSRFLDKPVTEDQLQKLKDYLSFEKMKKNQSTVIKHYVELNNALTGENRPVDTFIRKGKSGGYKDEMSEDYRKKFDTWFDESKHMKHGF